MAQPFGTTEVPDFQTLHERERQRLERRRYQNRYVTQPEPFVFHSRSSTAGDRRKLRQAQMAKDPSQDYRFRRNEPASARPASAGHCNGYPSLKAVPVVVPPRTTEKTLRAQQAMQRQLQERREQQLQEQKDLERAQSRGSFEMRCRIKRAVGLVQPFDEKIDRIVADKQHNSARVVREKQRVLHNIQERVNRRPLLMEQRDCIQRARSRALFAVKKTLEECSIPDLDRYFQDEELDELERESAVGDYCERP